MRSAPFVFAASLLTAFPALATGDFACTSPDKTARVDLGIGHVPVLAIVSVWIEAEGKSWSTYAAADGTEPVTVGQGFRGDGQMAVDFTDPNAEAVVARLRTWSVNEGNDWVEAGWLHIPGTGAWPMICGEG